MWSAILRIAGMGNDYESPTLLLDFEKAAYLAAAETFDDMNIGLQAVFAPSCPDIGDADKICCQPGLPHAGVQA
eukprot:9786600-Karenia_brevis.AAC.1